jgi:EAL domain-containing protein (putative c-di-GMP-specific phosphodiesterase class I)/signal transduction histidine kinase/DNA-binding response OmpR family regulator
MQDILDENEYLREKLAATEAASEFRQELHQTLSGAINIGYWEWDEITKRPAYFSEEMATIMGMSQESLYQQYQCEEDLYQFIHPDDLQYYIDNLSAILDPDHPRGLAHAFDYRIIRPDGEVRHLRELEYGKLEKDGVVTRTFGAVQDITDRQESLHALQQSEHRYSALFDQLPVGVEEQDYSSVKKMVDKLQSQGIEDLKSYFESNPQLLREAVRNTRVINANDTLLKIHETDSLEEFIEAEEDVSDWWEDNWVEFYAAEIADLAGPDRQHEAELKETRMDDSIFETRMITRIVKGDEDTWNRVLTIVEDVTERKRYETNLIEAKTAAEKASMAKTEFLSNMSHELRTPLNAILGFSQLFEYDASLGEQRQSKARAINDAGKHLLNLVDEILDLSRIEAGNIDLSMEAVSLGTVIKNSVAWVADMAKSHGISIDFDPVVYRGVLVEADAVRLKQVFLNLLSNAVKYNRENGKIRIDFTLDAMGLARISIADTGPGIAADRLEELFKPFNRLGAEFSAIEGTGIGLVITRQLVELMQGELTVDSTPGQGSTFTVQFQTVQSSQPYIEFSSGGIESAEEAVPTLMLHKPHLLVAEDNPVNQQLMGAQLELLGYTADYAENGIEALKLWKTGNYRLLLTDIRMPEMDGYELIGQIRALESSGEASPIIAVTANAMERDIKRCLDTGANDVISKPFTLEALKQVLEKWSPQQAASEASTTTATKAPHSAQGEAIDLSILRESVGDKVAVHRLLLKSYSDTLPQALDEIQQALGRRNHEQLGDYAHKLKSSSAGLGATRIAGLCQTLELACREGREAEINATVPQLLEAAAPVTTFVEVFCSESRAATVQPPVQMVDDVSESQVSVLLVDDDHIMHRVVTLILNDMGIHQVHTALSGQRGLEILEQMQNAIDIIICDLNMPEMDGIEFTRHLARQNYSGALALSSGEDIRILRTVEKLAIEHELQVIGVLEKPVTLAKMNRLLEAYDQANNEWTVAPTEVFSVDELLHAITSDQLDTYFQPKIDVKTRQIVGVEALVRWQHPSRGIVSPNSFIPMAEEHNLISDLTMAVCQKALQYAAAWQGQGIELEVALNISVDTLNDLDWPNAIAAQVEAAGLQPTTITFEITESRLMENISVALDILSRLSLKRFNLSIDDFGTGYSSMEQLQRIPFSELKIDRAFVHGASKDVSARAILESSVLLAKKLDMKIVAEGVETEEDWNLVAELGCDQVQGYYIAKPMPAEQLLEWLGEWQKSER